MSSNNPLSTTEILAAAQSALYESGYSDVIAGGGSRPALHGNSRILQNNYSVVMLTAFETWEKLHETWPDYQDEMVAIMSSFLTKENPKAWDGYLVLLTPGSISTGDRSNANRIRADTSRLRKLLGTGDEIGTISDVRKVIASLLPISIDDNQQADGREPDALPRILEKHGIPAAATKVVLESFKANAPIMQRLHEFLLHQ